MEHPEYSHLHDLIHGGDAPAVHQFLTSNPQLLNAEFDNGDTWLHLAALHEQPDVVHVLAQHGLDPNQKNKQGKVPFWNVWHASIDGSLPTMEALLKCGADPNAQYNSVKNFLHVAIHSAEKIRLLLQYGADPNILDQDGCSPLYHAVSLGSMSAVLILLEGGADPRLKTDHLESPLEVAKRNGHQEIEATMKAWMSAQRASSAIEEVSTENGLGRLRPLGFLR